MMLMLLISAAWADCHVEQIDTRVRFVDGAALREDRVSLAVGTGAPCTSWLLDGGDPGAELLDVRGRLRRPDRRSVRVELDRVIDPAGPWRAPPTRRLSLPDALLGSTLEMVVRWRVPGDQFMWDPAPQGPVAVASVTVAGGTAWKGQERLPVGEGDSRSWSWEDVADQTRPLILRRDGAQAVTPPSLESPAWRLRRTGDEATIFGAGNAGVTVPIVYGHVSASDVRRAVAGDRVTLPVGSGEGSEWPDGVQCSPTHAPATDAPFAEVSCTVAAASSDAWIPVPDSGTVPDDSHRVGAADAVAGRLELSLAPHQSSNLDEPPVGTARWSWRVSALGAGDAEGADQAQRAVGMGGFTAPVGARDIACSVSLGDRELPGTVDGRRCTFPLVSSPSEARGANTSWAWEWREDTVPVVGEIRLAEAWGARAASFEVVAPGADIVVMGSTGVTIAPVEGGARAEAHNIAAAERDGLGAPASARVTWRLRAIGERPVLADRAATLDLLALRALRASMPEPALPLEYKHRKDGEDLVPPVLSLVRQRLVPGRVLGQSPLQTRLLVDALQSGWGTDWEQALLLTRYLRQLKLDALPVAVRPAAFGDADPAAPIGYASAVVRVGQGDETFWLAPACQLCGPGELPPELGGARALSRALDHLPPQVPGRLDVVQRRDGTATVTLEGAAALGLRRHIRQAPLDERYDAILEWLRAPGATLTTHTGLAARGEAITLQVQLPAGWSRPLGPALPRPALEGPPRVLLPWAGTWQWRIEGQDGAPPEAIERSMPGLRWRREADAKGVTEVLRVEEAQLSRTGAARLLAEAHANRSGLRPIEAAPPEEGDDLIEDGAPHHDE
jgi:hypothetical protein